MQLTRRDWLIGSSLMALSAQVVRGGSASVGYTYQLAQVSGLPATLPAGGYVPFDWAVAEVPPTGTSAADDPVTVSWQSLKRGPKSRVAGLSARLRITSATDVREAVEISVKTAVSGRPVGTFDSRFAMYLQPFELPIQPADLEAVLTEGVTLTMTSGSKPFWFFRPDAGGTTAPTAYLPHLLVYGKADPNAWKDRLLSLESVQSFGWMEGCVMDGLHELSGTLTNRTANRAKTALAQHLDLFFGHNNLVYANLNNRKAVGIINTVESILPFAILAQTNPGHPLLQTAIQFCQVHASADGVIADGTGPDRTLKTEECYTVSYPLAVLAQMLNRPDLANLAIQTALARVRLLAKGGSIYQRGTEAGTSGGTALFENWSRGVAWYLLGLVKTLTYLPQNAQTQPLHTALQTAVDTVLSYQQPSGLWYCFMHQPETGLETSGTAGIAAALAYGAHKNHLPKTVLRAVRKAKTGLDAYLTPDGYLTGTAQGNKGGDTLQRGGFRVISPYTLGFLAHIDTYLT